MHKQAPLTLDDETRKRAINSLRDFASRHLDDNMSELQATLLLDHVLEDLGPSIYNLGLGHARAFMEERAGDLDAVLHKGEFPASTRRAR